MRNQESADQISDQIIIANDQIYSIIGMPKTNEPEGEIDTLVNSKDKTEIKNNLIFTKRCLFQLKIDHEADFDE